MRTSLLTLALSILFLSPAIVAAQSDIKHASPTTAGETVIAHVEGMVCDFCARGLEKVFGKKDEVSDIIVSLEYGTITINMKPDQDLTDTEITRLIEGNGINTTSIQRESTDALSAPSHDHSDKDQH